MKIKNLVNKFLFVAALLACAGIVVSSQQSQTSTAPLQPANAKYVQGVGVGYWPTPGSGLTLNVAAGSALCFAAPVTYAGGTLTMANNTTNYIYLNTASSCAPATKTTAFVTTDIPIAKVLTVSGAIATIMDLRTAPIGPITQTIASGTLTLATNAIGFGTCQTVTAGSVNSVAATGVLTTDVPKFSFNGDPTGVVGFQPSAGGPLTVIPYPTAGYVNVAVCNYNTSGSITPGAITFNWTVQR